MNSKENVIMGFDEVFEDGIFVNREDAKALDVKELMQQFFRENEHRKNYKWQEKIREEEDAVHNNLHIPHRQDESDM